MFTYSSAAAISIYTESKLRVIIDQDHVIPLPASVVTSFWREAATAPRTSLADTSL